MAFSFSKRSNEKAELYSIRKNLGVTDVTVLSLVVVASASVSRFVAL